MNQEEAFLQAVHETPDDDAPRLIYADWLDENDQADRAEFIRVQCQLAGMDPFDERRPDLAWRQRQLLLGHGKAWGKAARKFTKKIDFIRGFVGRMTLTASRFLKSSSEVFARAPVQQLRLLQVDKRLPELVAFEPLARLKSLDLHSCRLGMARTITLAGCPHLAGLEELNLGSVKMRLNGARAVCTSPHLAGLRTLNLHSNLLDDGFAAMLAASSTLKRLIRLDLSSNQISDDGLERLGRIERLGGLVDLDLSENRFGDDGARRLASSNQWVNLRRLNLSETVLGRDGVVALAGCRWLSGLHELYLSRLPRGGGLRELADSPYLTNLRALDVGGWSPIDDDSMQALVESPLLKGLRLLRLSRISPASARLLLRSPSSASLQRLTLAGTSAGPALGAEIAAATHLTHLTELDLAGNALGDEGLAALAAAPHLSRLTVLRLQYNGVTDAGLTALLQGSSLPRLEQLTFEGNRRPSPALQQALSRRFGEHAWS